MQGDVWRIAAEAGMRVPELENEPEPPTALYLWKIFGDIASSSISEGKLLAYSEVYAWSQLTGRHLLPWELDAIRSLDRLYAETKAKQDKQRQDAAMAAAKAARKR